MYRSVLVILFSLFLQPVFAQRARDTFKLFFDLGVPKLNRTTEKKIDLLIYNDKIISGSTIMIIGYADYLGTESRNKTLSMKRAENVKDYLVKYGINGNDIKLCEGKGEIDRIGATDKGGMPTDRRVDIVVNNRTKKKPVEKPKPVKLSNQKVVVNNIDEIKSLKPGSIFLLRNVYFPPDRHIIKNESRETLEKLYISLRDNPGLKISIEGHVCCISPDAPDAQDGDNGEIALSVNRAKAIYNYLVGKGIDASRLKYEGFGKRRPVVKMEMTDEDAERNRRVEIRILENK
ncbi:MAG: OmpA family protein [Flavipsychrobacter sp.]|nr:OmpA family protein [Flavipsychrobacter sp.]